MMAILIHLTSVFAPPIQTITSSPEQAQPAILQDPERPAKKEKLILMTNNIKSEKNKQDKL